MQVKCMDFYGKVHFVDADDLIDRLSAYGVYITEGKILLIQDPRSLRWELPGGGIESGEAIRQGLTREFAEEAGMTVVGKPNLLTEWTEYFFDVTSAQAWRSKRQFYMVSEVRGNLLVNGNGDDSATARLVPLNEIKDLTITQSV